MTEPTLRLLSLGAGVQSTTLLLLIVQGRLPMIDAAIFADTQSEPAVVYKHLDRIEREIARPAGIPILRVSAGNLAADALNPEHRFASMPLFIANPDGTRGIARRQCTKEYKLTPIKQAARRLLDAAPNTEGVPRRARWAETLIGFSLDEIVRVKDSPVRYLRNVYPLLEMGWRRTDCLRFLERCGYSDTPKSACVQCPFRRNAGWRRMRDQEPEDWTKAIAFDHAIRGGGAHAIAAGHQLHGQAFLHESRVPLELAPIDTVTRAEWRDRQADLDLFTEDPDGCSPWACRSGEPATA